MEILILLVAAMFYLFPTLVAISNKKRNAGAIATLNILAGWLFVPWIIALTWAMCKEDKGPQ